MLHNVIALAIAATIALVVTLAVGQVRRKAWKGFSSWWDGEGVPIFIVLFFLLIGIFVWRGWLLDL